MAEGRGLFRLYPHNIFFPGICLAFTVPSASTCWATACATSSTQAREARDETETKPVSTFRA